MMPLWQRLAITVVAIAAAGQLAGHGWNRIFDITLPSYDAGLVGGLAALPVWEILKREGPTKSGSPESVTATCLFGQFC